MLILYDNFMLIYVNITDKHIKSIVRNLTKCIKWVKTKINSNFCLKLEPKKLN